MYSNIKTVTEFLLSFDQTAFVLVTISILFLLFKQKSDEGQICHWSWASFLLINLNETFATIHFSSNFSSNGCVVKTKMDSQFIAGFLQVPQILYNYMSTGFSLGHSRTVSDPKLFQHCSSCIHCAVAVLKINIDQPPWPCPEKHPSSIPHYRDSIKPNVEQ